MKEQSKTTIGNGKGTSLSPHQTWCQRLAFAKEFSCLIKGQDPKVTHEVKEFTYTALLHSLLDGLFNPFRSVIKTIKVYCNQDV